VSSADDGESGDELDSAEALLVFAKTEVSAMNGDWRPTARLRFVRREEADDYSLILQQYWAPELPPYLQNERDGEWRDVEVAQE
jgi:hypothetical protein